MNEALVTASYLKRKFPNDPKMREVIDFIESSRNKGFMHGIVLGGIVTWITGLTFSVSETVYYIMNLLCEAGGLVTLSPADPDLPRIDLIVINSDWEVEVIEGIPADNPLQPTPDPQTQLALTYVLIPAAATEPDNITEIIVFNEHVAGEFTPSASGVAVNFDYTDDKYAGSKSMSVGAIGNNDTISLTSDAPKLKADYESFSLFLKLKASASKSHALYAQFRLAGVAVSNEVALPFNLTDTTSWQNISLLLSAFTFSNAQFDSLRLRWSKTGTQTDFTGFYLDYIKLQKGIVQPTFVDTVELTGDVTGKGKTGTPFETTLKNVITAGTFGSATKSVTITVDAKGRITSVTENTIEGGGGIPDAPANGNKYARKDNTWVIVLDGTNGKSVELSTSGGYFVWRLVGDPDWIQLYPVPTDGNDGASAYVYVAYASGIDGAGFTLVNNDSLAYMAIKATPTPIASPVVGDFAGLWFKRRGADGAGGQLSIVNKNVGSFTLELTDANNYIRANYPSTVTVTIPNNSAVAFEVGCVITIEQTGTGQVTLIPASGVTLNAFQGGVTTYGRYYGLQIIQVEINVWTLIAGTAQ